MTERPILYTGVMVRAYLAGQKTQTRRLLYVKTKRFSSARWHRRYPPDTSTDVLAPGQAWTLSHWHRAQVGDRLWAREAWAEIRPAGSPYPATMYVYAAGDNRTDYGGPWKPSIHMPRAACRFTQDLTNVRIQRLQDISHDDACAEGIESTRGGKLACIERYAVLWDSINGHEPGCSWDDNPWVVAMTFPQYRPGAA